MGDIHTTQQLMGVRVEHAKKPGKRLGRVRHFIFHPTKRKIVGFAVKRPDAALMFHRSDIFVALDGYSVVDGVVMINDDSQSTGRAACKRLGISWDNCVIWQGLLLGRSELPASLIEGFKIGIGDNLSKASEDETFRGAIVVSPEAL